MRSLFAFALGIITGVVATSAAGAWLFREDLEDELSVVGRVDTLFNSTAEEPQASVVEEDEGQNG